MRRNTFSILFFAKKGRPLRDGTLPLYLRVTVNCRSKETALNIGISGELWDPKAQRVRGSSKLAKEINEILRETETDIRIIHRDALRLQLPITADLVMNEFRGKERKQWTIISCFEEHQRKFSELVEKGHCSVRTLKRYETTLQHLRTYTSKTFGNREVAISEVDLRYIEGFEHYLKVDADCAHNSAMKHVKGLRKVILQAYKEGLIQTDPFNNYTIRTKPVEKEFLTESEVDSIYLKFIPNERLVTIRDVFIFQCYTGMAYCDIAALRSEHIVTDKDDRTWVIKPREKTGNSFRVPLLPRAKEILDRYAADRTIRDMKLLPVSSNQKMNAYLKEIGLICGLDKNLTTHLARHTFATMALNRDVPEHVLQRMMGITKRETIEVYAKLVDSTIAREMDRLNDEFK